MFNKVILTFSTRIITAILSVINVLVGTNYLGVEGFGTISLIILGITVYLMVQNIVAGSPIVYFSNKIPSGNLIAWAYIWLIASISIFCALTLVLNYASSRFNLDFEFVPGSYLIHNILLAGSYGLMNIHLNFLLGRERIRSYNFVFLMQHMILTISLIYFFLLSGKNEIEYYISSMYIAYLSSYLIAVALSTGLIDDRSKLKRASFRKMFRYGSLGQTANVFQLINYRLSYYLIDYFIGRAGLGLFSAATQICEGLWIFGKSISTVLFARISNSNDFKEAHNLTIRIAKFVVYITILPLLVLMLMPHEFYKFLLGPSFANVRDTIWWLAPGTIFLSSSVLLSSYFSGTGKISRNTWASGYGVIVTLIFGIILIPELGIKGAGLVTSLSYFISFGYLILKFNREQKIGIDDIILTSKDIGNILSMIFSRKK